MILGAIEGRCLRCGERSKEGSVQRYWQGEFSV